MKYSTLYNMYKSIMLKEGYSAEEATEEDFKQWIKENLMSQMSPGLHF